MVRRFVYSKEPTIEAIALELGIDASNITRTKSRGEITLEFASDLTPDNVQKLNALYSGFKRS